MNFISANNTKKAGLVVCIFVVLLLKCLNINAQVGAWNSSSFKVTKDNSPLENMTFGTNVTYSGDIVSSSGSIPFNGFSFRYGLSSYNNFFISPKGFIKLGSNIISNSPEDDTSVIVPLYNTSSFNATYLTVGVYPNRKMVVEFSGSLQPSGYSTRYQIWLHERTGKIQFVYEQLIGYYGYSSFWNYKIFCKANILNKQTVTSLKINANNSLQTTSYTSVQSSFESIYANTRFTFQPDTLKPATPSYLSFLNVQAGCMAVNIRENSTNESVIALERADSGSNYKLEKTYYTSSPISTITYSYQQQSLLPFWNYSYRSFVSNGFLTSDTIYNNVQTLMPQLNGVVTVPGDYPSITALLQDATCKHLGPNLIIELLSNYSFAAETLPLTFKPVLQNRLIQSIVIRPAANATINWTASTVGPLFYVDSVRHVFIDGRPGGVGTSQSLTLFQQNPLSPVIQYTNAADSGGINYCRVIKKNSSYKSYAIIVLPQSSDGSVKKDINAFSITNNFISADSATVNNLIYIKPGDTTQARDFVISGNQLSRFHGSAVHFEGGGENLQIRDNHFFQPESFTPSGYIFNTNAACLMLLNNERITIDNNYFGGGSATWGMGKFTFNPRSTEFSFINYQNNSLTKKAFITNNKFGNIAYPPSDYPTDNKLIYAYKGDVVIANNKFGTADSSNSITTNSLFYGIYMFWGTKTVSNNFFSGFQASSGGIYFIDNDFTDSSAFINNDIGGSDNPSANIAPSGITCIQLSSLKGNNTIKNNSFRGMTSSEYQVTAIDGERNLALQEPLPKIEIDSNSIHHIQAASNVVGIRVNINSKETNRISHNNIYALKTSGTGRNLEGNLRGRLIGISYSLVNYNVPDGQFKGEVQVFGNKIHSFESLRALENSLIIHEAILVDGVISKIYNNEIRFGIDSKGQPVDSLTSIRGISVSGIQNNYPLLDKLYIEHNTIYFGGKGRIGTAIQAYDGSVAITNNIINIDRIPLATDYIYSGFYIYIGNLKPLSAKNIWYSSTIQNTAALLQTFKQDCRCDSSSFVGNPQFLNPDGDSSNYNLHLGAGSMADATGTPSVSRIDVDLDNNNRNAFSPVDIGCYSATPCGNGVLPTIAITSPGADSILLCNGITKTLTCSLSGGTFTSLQWQRNLIDSTGANSTSLTINSAGNYRLVGKTACGQVASKMINVMMTSESIYCHCLPTSSSVCSTGDIISRVSFGSIDTSTTCSANGYSDFTSSNQTTAITANASKPMSVQVGCSNVNPEWVGVWIDFNKNGIFERTEFTLLGSGCGSTITGSVDIPSNATSGLARMRVRVTADGRFNPSDACTQFSNGETEDYKISITPFSTCPVFTWTGTVSTVWENPANWSCGIVPGRNANVLVNSGNVIISSNVTVYSLTVKPGASVRVVPPYNLVVTH